jgi:hypothetical protein
MSDVHHHPSEPEHTPELDAEPPARQSAFLRAVLVPVLVFIAAPIVLSLIVKYFFESWMAP